MLEEQSIGTPALFGGYKGIAILVGILWVLALLVFFRFGKKKKKVAAAHETQPEPTLAERLRPLLERAAAGKLSADEKAMLERMLITHWQRRLGLVGKGSD